MSAETGGATAAPVPSAVEPVSRRFLLVVVLAYNGLVGWIAGAGVALLFGHERVYTLTAIAVLALFTGVNYARGRRVSMGEDGGLAVAQPGAALPEWIVRLLGHVVVSVAVGVYAGGVVGGWFGQPGVGQVVGAGLNAPFAVKDIIRAVRKRMERDAVEGDTEAADGRSEDRPAV